MHNKLVQCKALVTVTFRKYACWSALSYIGKNPISKLIIFAPIVAQVLLHTPQPSVLNGFDFQWLHWAYWSVILFSMGQLIYTLKCPSNIKEFPNRHNYILTLDKTETNENLRVDAFENIRESFVGHGGSLEISEGDIEKLQVRLSVPEVRPELEAIDETDAEKIKIFDNYVLLYEGLRKSGRVRGIEWTPIYNNLHILEEYITETQPERSWVDFYNLRSKIKKYALSKSWRVNLLDLRYKNENISFATCRAACILLYGCGMVYFVYSGITNVFKVAATYFFL